MTRRWFGLLTLAIFEIATSAGPVIAQTVTVDASEAIRQIHMSDMITSGEQLQQQRFQSMMQSPMGGYSSGSSVPHMDRSQADALARKAAALDRFAPDAAGTKASAHDSALAYAREGANHVGADKLLAGLIAKTHDSHSAEQIFSGLITSWHSIARKNNFGNSVSQATLFVVETAYAVRSTDPRRPEQSTLDQLSFGLQNAIVALQLSRGHAFSNTDKQELYDSLGANGLLIAILATGKFGDDLAAEAKAEADGQIAKFGPSSDAGDLEQFAHSVEHRATTTVLLRYPDVLALR